MRHIKREWECDNIADIALSKLKSLPVDAAEVSLGQSQGFSVSARQGEVETIEHHLDKTFNVTVYQNHCTGYASSSDFSNESITATIKKALSIASFSNPDPYAGLVDLDQLAKTYPNCDLYHPWLMTLEEAIALAIQCEKKAMSHDKRIVNSEGASVSTVNSHSFYANTLGFIGECDVSEHSIACSVVARDHDQMQRESEYTVARNAADLQSIDWVATHTADKTVNRLNARKIKTQTCSVIFEASVAKSLMSHFISAVSGGNLYRQTSFLLDMLGKPIFPAFLNIFQEPHLLSAMGSCPFDQDGVTTRNQHYIRDGVLEKYVLSGYSARKLGLTTTGNAGGVFNLSVSGSGSERNLKELCQTMNRGLFVTELMGQGVNITTGDYSRGAAGFWIDNGEIQFAVEEITIAGNLKNMLAGIVAIADDVDIRGRIRTGSILIDHMTIAGE